MFFRSALATISLAMAATAQDGATPFAAFDLASPPILSNPGDLAIGPDGNLYVAERFAGRLTVLDPDTLELIATRAIGKMPGVRDVSFGPDGSVVTALTGAAAVAVYSGISALDDAPDQMLPAARTEGALAHSNGRIYVMDGGMGQVFSYENGMPIAAAGRHPGAHDIAEDLQGNIWVADNQRGRLVKYAQDLTQLQVLDDPKFGFAAPKYLDFDDFGRLVVADQNANRILLIDPDGTDGGTLLGVLGDGRPGLGPNKFDGPQGIAVLGNSYYVSDSDNNRVVRYTVVLN